MFKKFGFGLGVLVAGTLVFGFGAINTAQASENPHKKCCKEIVEKKGTKEEKNPIYSHYFQEKVKEVKEGKKKSH